jgi:hypothetical protein
VWGPGGGPQIASRGVGFTSVVVRWRVFAAFWARDIDTGGCRLLGIELSER